MVLRRADSPSGVRLRSVEVEANFHDVVLKISIAKSPEAETKRMEVKTS